MSTTTEGVEQVARAACQHCHEMTVELSAAMDRIEVLIVERDMARGMAPKCGHVVVDAEELADLREAVAHAKEYIRSDRQMKREWKGWTLDEFDAACERLDTRKVSA